MGQFDYGVGLDLHGGEEIQLIVVLGGRRSRGDVGKFGVDVGEDAGQPTIQNIVVVGRLVGELGRQRRPLAGGFGILGRRAVARQLRAHDLAVLERVAHDQIVVLDGDGHLQQHLAHGRGPAQQQWLAGQRRIGKEVEIVAPRDLRVRHAPAHAIVEAPCALGGSAQADVGPGCVQAGAALRAVVRR